MRTKILFGVLMFAAFMAIAIELSWKHQRRLAMLAHDRDAAYTRAVDANHRIKRICNDAKLKLKLAEAWAMSADPQEQLVGDQMIATLDGVRAICDEENHER